MAALICILLNFPKGASLASSGFFISTFHRYKNCKKTSWGLQSHVHLKKTAFHDWTNRLTNGIAYQWPISCSIVYLLNPSIPRSFVNEMAVIDYIYSVIDIIVCTRKATKPTNWLPIKQQRKELE